MNNKNTTINIFPLVTIGIPTYNRYDQLKTCLGNALEQTYPHIEILVSDNTQDYPTPAWLLDLVDSKEKIKYIRQQKNLGAIGNHQFLIDNAQGSYFMFLHDDDEIPKNYVSVMMKNLIDNPNVTLIGPCCDRHRNGKYWYTYENWDSRGKATYLRLRELIPDAFTTQHARFEQYMYGVFKISGIRYKVSPTFKSQFHMFFYLSCKGELMNAPEITTIKNTTDAEVRKHKTNPKGLYTRYWILKFFNDRTYRSIQQCLPIGLQMSQMILLEKSLSLIEKVKLISLISYHFVNISLRDEYRARRLKIIEFANWALKRQQ